MSYISCIVKKQQKCPSCDSSLQASQNTQLYCASCQACPVLLEQPFQVVPSGYRSNSQPSIQKNLQNVRSYLKKFANACGFRVGQQDLTILSAEVMSLHNYKGNQYRKGYQQNSACIIFSHFREQHKITMSVRQFCKKCGVRQSRFNKFYIDNCQRKNSMNKNKKQLIQGYENQLQQKFLPNLDMINQSQQKEDKHGSFYQQVKKVMDKIYDQIFLEQIYKQLRTGIISQIVLKVVQYSQKVLEMSIDEYSSIKITQIQLILYMIFSIVKRAGLRMPFSYFRRKIIQSMRITLNGNIIRKFKSSYDKIVSDQRATIVSISTTVSAQGQSMSQNQQI